ncbi:MAG TPA: nitronate monooxygenase [Marmoricola sp.]|nr:nitronate monooxygenase [Marmoricola sp.]
MDLLDRLRLEVPVFQAGMGGGIAGPELAGAVAAAGGLGTLGLTGPGNLRTGIGHVRERAPGRAVAVNLLMPFVRRRHVEACLAEHVEAVVLFYGGDAGLVRTLHDAGVLVISQVGTPAETREALGWGVDALIAQGAEAGGHLLGRAPAATVLEQVRAVAGTLPVLVAGGVADGRDTARALRAGAAGVVAGTRFLLTIESRAHPLYRDRVLAARETLETTLFGLAWPARHRVVPNAATRRWLRPDGSVRSLPRALNTASAPLGRIATDAMAEALPHLQRARVPLLSPAPPRSGLPDAAVESTPLYAGESARRIDTVVTAAEAVRLLTPTA